MTVKQATASRTDRILLVDDHPLMRHGLTEAINGEPELEVCGEASDPVEALQRITSDRPDLIIIDISLQDGGNGIELIKDIRAQSRHIKMLVISMHDERLFAERALRAGALGYVNKNEPAETMVQAIRQVLSSRIWLSPQMAERVLNQMAGERETSDGSSLGELTDRELEVFEMIGRGFSTKQIASKLHLSPKTVETYREHIKRKLDLTTGSQLVHRAVRWILEGR